MAKNAVSEASVIVNNTLVPIVPNTLKFTEGFGEYTVRGQSAGGGRVQTVFAENAELKKSKIMFEIFNTAENIKLARQWKAAKTSNLIEVSTSDFNRTFSSATLVSDFEVEIGSDQTITLEFESDPAS